MGIKLQSINKELGSPPTQILCDINLEINDGEFTALVGRSGFGKSSLLYVMSTLDRATSGQVIIDNTDINLLTTAQLHQFRNGKMGFVFQFHYLLPELTAMENILMPAMKSGREKELRGRALALLKEFDIEAKAQRRPQELSGGEQQRIAIAQSLIMSPHYIFADEPTGNLDSVNGQMVMDTLIKINKDFGTTIIYVTHDTEFAAYAQRQLSMVDGRLVPN